MKIMLIQLGTQCECFVTTSLIKGMKKQIKEDIQFYVLVQETESKVFFKHHPLVKEVWSVEEVAKLTKEPFFEMSFDILVNLSPRPQLASMIKAEEKIGIGFSTDYKKYFDVLYGTSSTGMNLFQVYFKLCGLKWRGEGFDFTYYPKSRSKKDKTGVAVANINLKNFIVENLELEETSLWNIPLKRNVLRRLDEINRCGNVITDDFFTLQLALFLRKNVYFLKTVPYRFNIELFNSGQIFQVPYNVLQLV